ncbi:TPA: hypothetical protein ACGCM7_005456 [Klebsiella pneumoniae]
MNDVYSEWYLACGISHMKNKSRIDKRCLYLTVHLKNRHSFEKFNFELFEFLKSIVEYEKLPLYRYPSLISSLDFEGSKEGQITDKLPHTHSLIFFPKESAEGVSENYISRLSYFLSENKHVDKKVKNCFFMRKFYNDDEFEIHDQITNVINYNRKSRISDERELIVLPYMDVITSSYNEITKNKIVNDANKIINELVDQEKRHKYYSKNNLIISTI